MIKSVHVFCLFALLFSVFSCDDTEEVTSNPSILVRFNDIDSTMVDVIDTVSIDTVTMDSIVFNLDTISVDTVLIGIVDIEIDQLNGRSANSFEQIGENIDSEFNLPVDLNEDTTIFSIRFFLESDTNQVNPLNEVLAVRYRRNIVQGQLRNVSLQIDSIDVIQNLSSFDSLILDCFTPLCFQTEARIDVFF